MLRLIAKMSHTGTLGPCPWCHKAGMALQLKGLAYDVQLVSLVDKPAWLLELNPAGTVPVLIADGKPIPDSEAILEYAEKLQPEPSLLTTSPVRKEVGATVWTSYLALLKNDTPGKKAAVLRSTLDMKLGQIDSHLAQSGMPFLAADRPTAADCQLLPQLYQIEVSGHLVDFTIPAQNTNLLAYMKRGFALDAFLKTKYTPETVVEHMATMVGQAAKGRVQLH